MPIADWTVPFKLTSTVYTNHPEPLGLADNPLMLNVPVTLPGGNQGVFRLRNDACQLTNTVRQTKEYIPQFDGAILHRRFVGGMEMSIVMQLWEPGDKIACDETLQEMLDAIMGYLYGLLNADDNEGRIAWAPTGGASGAPGSNGYRMMEDIRLLTYPVGSQSPGAPYELSFVLDTIYPYAEDETQLSVTLGASTVVTNYGDRPTYPVFKIYGNGGDNFQLANVTTSQVFNYNGAQPGGLGTIGALTYIELNTMRNTAFENGNGANASPGIVMETSEFLYLLPGPNTITLANAGAASLCLVNAAWA